jgi:hypothetical protein
MTPNPSVNRTYNGKPLQVRLRRTFDGKRNNDSTSQKEI